MKSIDLLFQKFRIRINFTMPGKIVNTSKGVFCNSSENLNPVQRSFLATVCFQINLTT